MGKGEKRKLNPADEFRKKQRQKELKKVSWEALAPG
jgi:hypothetical protein